MSYTEDWVGDKSSKRLTAFILLGFSLSHYLGSIHAIKGIWGNMFSFCLGFIGCIRIDYS